MRESPDASGVGADELSSLEPPLLVQFETQDKHKLTTGGISALWLQIEHNVHLGLSNSLWCGSVSRTFSRVVSGTAEERLRDHYLCD